MEYNVRKLTSELLAVGLPIIGCDINGAISWNNTPTADQLMQAKGIVDAHDPVDYDEIAKEKAVTDYGLLDAWAKTGTADGAATFITEQILGGYTSAQVDNYLETNITAVTAVTVAQVNARITAIKSALKLIGDSLVMTRTLFIVVAKLLIYIRDLIIRFR